MSDWIELPRPMQLGGRDYNANGDEMAGFVTHHPSIEGDVEIKPGMLLELIDGSRILVGNVNGDLGVCDCCREYGYMVRRYKMLEGLGLGAKS